MAKQQKTKKCKECGKTKEIKEFRKNSNSKAGYTLVCNECIVSKRKNYKKEIKNKNIKYYIYRFLDKNDNVLYVGQTIDIDRRYKSHISNALQLPTNNQFDLYQAVRKMEYCEVESDYHMNIYEIHYICKYKPKFNIQFKTDNEKLFDLPEVKWKTYIPKDYIKDCSLYYLCHHNIDYDELKEKLKNDKQFYIEFEKEYLNCTNYLRKQFDALYFNDDFYDYEDED